MYRGLLEYITQYIPPFSSVCVQCFPRKDNTLSHRRGRSVGWKSWDKPWLQSFENGREGRMWSEEMCSNTTGSSPRSWVKQSTKGQGSLYPNIETQACIVIFNLHIPYIHLRWRLSCVCNPRPIQYKAAWSSTREVRLKRQELWSRILGPTKSSDKRYITWQLDRWNSEPMLPATVQPGQTSSSWFPAATPSKMSILKIFKLIKECMYQSCSYLRTGARTKFSCEDKGPVKVIVCNSTLWQIIWERDEHRVLHYSEWDITEACWPYINIQNYLSLSLYCSSLCCQTYSVEEV